FKKYKQQFETFRNQVEQKPTNKISSLQNPTVEMKGTKFGIIILGIVIILIALIQAGQKTPIDWEKTYNPHDKIPFGTYVIQEELKSVFPKNISIEDIDQSLYQYLSDSIAQQAPCRDLFFIGSQFHPGKTAMDAL